jgi:hypothetical protein
MSENLFLFNHKVIAAINSGNKQLVTEMISQSTAWLPFWTLAVLQTKKEDMVDFWLETAPSDNVISDLCSLTASCVLYIYKMSSSPSFYEWIDRQDMTKFDAIFSQYNPYRAFLEQRKRLQKAADDDALLATAHEIIDSLHSQLADLYALRG